LGGNPISKKWMDEQKFKKIAIFRFIYPISNAEKYSYVKQEEF
jgi:hypothetical protein